jgi:4'-phosphopantetheinyl transferase
MDPSVTAACSDISNVSWKLFNKDSLTGLKGAAVFIADLKNFKEADFIRLLSYLDDAEKGTALGFKNDQSKKQFILAHSMLRYLLSGLLNCPLDEIIFDLSSSKKPFIRHPHTSLHFNISHSGSKVIIALHAEEEIGVDIERKDNRFDYPAFAAAHFSTGEKKLISTQHQSEAIENFYAVWTRKEAWLKLTGEGLTDNLFAYDVSNMHAAGKIQIITFNVEDYLVSIATENKTQLQFFEVKNSWLK